MPLSTRSEAAPKVTCPASQTLSLYQTPRIPPTQACKSPHTAGALPKRTRIRILVRLPEGSSEFLREALGEHLR